MRSKSWIVLALILIPVVAVAAVTETPEPICLNTAAAKTSGNTVTVPVTNNTTGAVEVEVVAQYDDGSQVHLGSSVVSIKAKTTVFVPIGLDTITDDINPFVGITEGPDPITGMIALGAALWVD